MTYGQLRDHCRALAIRLQTVFHLNYGDSIALCLPNSIEFPTICLAGKEAGMIVTTINPIYTAGERFLIYQQSDKNLLLPKRFLEEMARQLIDSDAKIIFGLGSMSKVLQAAVALTKLPIKIVYAKSIDSEILPAGGIDINELINPKSLQIF